MLVLFNSSTSWHHALVIFGLIVTFLVNVLHARGQFNETHIHCVTKELCDCCKTASRIIRCKDHVLYIGYQFCLTWNNSSDKLEINRCLQLHTHKHPRNSMAYCGDLYSIPTDITGPELNNLTCKMYNRKGPQCRECLDGHGPAVFSDRVTCADCSKHKHLWILNLIFQLTMVTIAYFSVILLQIKGTNSPYNIMTAYGQVGTNALMIGTSLYDKAVCFTSKSFVTIAITISAMLNLDFFRLVIPPMCISTSMKSIDVIVLDYVIAFYPIILTVFIYTFIELHDRNCWVIYKPTYKLFECFRHRDWKPKETVLNTFATFLLLSYSKFTFVSFSLFFVDSVYHCNGEVIPNSKVLLYDPSIRFLHPEHIPYVVLACSVILIFVLLPPLILLLYPTRLFKKWLSCCGFRRWDVLQMIMDIFQGCYRDGTDGGWDWRPLSSLYMVMRLVLALCGLALELLFVEELKIKIGIGVSHVLVGAMFLMVKPYKKDWMSYTDGLFLTLVGVTILTVMFESKVLYLLAIIVAMTLILFTALIVQFKCLRKVFAHR